MLGLILIFWVARHFYRLAEQHNKSKWAYAILSIAIWFGAQVLFGLGLAIFFMAAGEEVELDNMVISLLSLPISLAAVWLLNYLLKRSWKKQPNYGQLAGTLDDGMSVEQSEDKDRWEN